MARPHKKRLRRALASALQSILLSLGVALVPCLSRRGELRLARAIAWLFLRKRGRYRRFATENLALVYGDRLSAEDKDRILRAAFFNAARVITDYFWFARRTERRLARHCEIGDETMKKWIEGDFPGVLVTAHLGNWELAGLRIAASGRRLWSVFKPLGNRAVARRMRRFRGGCGQRVIPREGAMVGIVRALRARDLVAMLLDQHVEARDGGVYRDFLGTPATFSGAVGVLAHRLRAPILVAAAVHDGARDVYVMRSIREFTAEEVAATAPDALTDGIVRALEEMVLHWPEQWLWMYRRWKRWCPGDDPARFPRYARLDTSL